MFPQELNKSLGNLPGDQLCCLGHPILPISVCSRGIFPAFGSGGSRPEGLSLSRPGSAAVPAALGSQPSGKINQGRGKNPCGIIPVAAPRLPALSGGCGAFFCCCFLSSAASGWNQPIMERVGHGTGNLGQGWGWSWPRGWRGCSISILHPCRTLGEHGKFPAALMELFFSSRNEGFGGKKRFWESSFWGSRC